MGDSKAVEIIIAKRLNGQMNANIRRLVQNAQFTAVWESDWHSEEYTKIADLLKEQQNRMFSDLKSQRVQGRLSYFWKPLYRLYLDVEQNQYNCFNDWILTKRPKENPLVFEYQSWLPPTKVHTYLVLLRQSLGTSGAVDLPSIEFPSEYPCVPHGR